MLPSEAYDEWIDRHSRLFGLSADQDAKMLLEWVELFRQDGVTPADLMDATDWLARNEPPKHRLEHLHALQKRLRERRTSDRRKQLDEPPPDDRGACSLCGGSGMVSVPCLRSLAREMWGTQAVLCSCPMGRWVGERQSGRMANGENRHPLMTLGQYEMLRPDWRKVLADHDAKLVKEAGLRSQAKHLDSVMGELQRKWPSRRQPGFVRPNPDAS